MKTIVSLFFILIFFNANSQTPEEVLKTTRSVADKIIRETGFDYEWKALESNAGISFVKFPTSVSTENTEVYYVYYRIKSLSQQQSFLGISFQGELNLFLNKKTVYSGSSEKSQFKEYAYNRFLFNEKIPISLKAGENEILIKFNSRANSQGLLLGFCDEEDFLDYDLDPVYPVSNYTYSAWLLSGPYYSSDNNPMQQVFAPEKGFSMFDQQRDSFSEWKLQNPVLVRELKMDKQISYKRDAYADWNYANGGTMLSIYNFYKLTKEKNYLDFLEKYTSNITDNYDFFKYQYQELHALRGSFHRLFRMSMLDDTGGPALPFAAMMNDNSVYPFSPVLDTVLDYVINKQDRLKDGTLCRPEPEQETVWADDLFMSVPFLLRMAEITANDKLYDEVCRQIINLNNYLLNPASGLYFHGWYNLRNENAPVQWGRANGWFAWAVSEALLYLPHDHENYQEILSIYRRHIKSLVKVQNENGLWNQVLDHPETYDETSCSAMFTLAIARGVSSGWISKKYKSNAKNAWLAISQRIGYDGTVTGICRGTGIGENVDFYANRETFDHDPRGLGAVITAGTEVYKLISTKD